MFEPHFTITPTMLNALNRIEVIREKIALCHIHPKEEIRLKREAMLSMIHHSTAIEGNTLNEYDIQKVLEGRRIGASDREIYEVKNYKKALDWIAKKPVQPIRRTQGKQAHAQKTPVITEKDILRMHALLSAHVLRKDSSGRYRKESVYVVSRTPISHIIRYTAPDHTRAPSLVTDLCHWVNLVRRERLSPIIIAGIAHAEMAAIHPFVDGNGRAARLLATLILYTEKYDFRKLFALENYYNTNRPAYYDAIHLGKNYEERRASDLTPWLEYFITGFLAEMELVMDKIAPFLHRKKTDKYKKIILLKQEMRILDFLQEMNHISSADVEDILTVSLRTAQRYLAGLVQKGFLQKHGDKKGTKYTAMDGV